jgi:cytochrome c oxidase assembly protein subunit 15
MLMGVLLRSGRWCGCGCAMPAPAGAAPAALTLLTLFLTFDLVLFGAFTRLTDSGLGCPDWPGCYGNASPPARMPRSRRAGRACPPARSRTARRGSRWSTATWPPASAC